jgi:hypothetical protein
VTAQHTRGTCVSFALLRSCRTAKLQCYRKLGLVESKKPYLEGYGYVQLAFGSSISMSIVADTTGTYLYHAKMR